MATVADLIAQSATKYGISPQALQRIAQIESSMNPAARNPNSSAGGLFQFIDSTAAQYGLQDRFDPAQASDAAARLARDNKQALESRLGRPVSAGELYLAHQQGAGGALKLLSNPNARAVDIVGADAVRLNGGTPDMTAGEFAKKWISKAGGAAPMPTGGQQMAEQPQGLLGRARQPGGILSDTGFLSPDRRDRLILALEGMTLNPNQGLQQAALSGIQERSQQRATTQQRNQTAEWLRSRGREDLAAGVESGAIPAQAAVETALAPAADDRTALQKNYEFFLSQGMTPEQAMGAVKAGTTVNVQGQPQVGTIPQGYQLTQDKESGAYRMEAIPGGPADIEAQAAAQADVNSAELQEVKGSVINDQIDQALSLMEKKGALDILPEAGILGGALGAMGINQDAVDLQNTLASIQSAVAFDTLQKMREASKTGGALGAVSERELDLLISAYGALQQSSSPDLLRKNLQTVREIMGKIESDPVAGAFYQSDGQRSAPAASNNGGFTVNRRLD